MLKILSAAIVGLALFLALGLKPTPETNTLGLVPLPEKRILFIGNSYTYGGDIPWQVKNIAATSNPSANYHVEMVALGGMTLGQHLIETEALAKIQEGNWDVVVLQDHSGMSFHPEGVSRMEQAARTFANMAQQQGTEILYFAHWAPVGQAGRKTEAIHTIDQAYERLAQDVGGHVARVGMLWQLADNAGLEGLYSNDEHHSSLKGAYAAALAIVVALDDVDVNTSIWAPEGVPLVDQEKLRTAAATLSLNASKHGVSAANPGCEVSNIAIVDGETLKPEENDHETLRWN
jgi:hypothetical protein